MTITKPKTSAEWFNFSAEAWNLWMQFLNKHHDSKDEKASRVGDKIYSRYLRRYREWVLNNESQRVKNPDLNQLEIACDEFNWWLGNEFIEDELENWRERIFDLALEAYLGKRIFARIDEKLE